MAFRIAKKLGLPFVSAVRKIRSNEPQKLQRNRYHLCYNLDGAFEVSGAKQGAPVLLIDDLVHSAWTITIVSVLLRQAGSGPVWPAVLTTNNNRL
jgi:ATP-dependent DNA helicase RecQ